MDYGTGAIFGCPAHDQRDYDFATKYDLPIIPVVAPLDVFDNDTDLVVWIEQFAAATRPISTTASSSIPISSTA